MDSVPLDELAAQAHETSVVVVGGGIGGLAAAWECAKVGIRVAVVEASDRLGGAVETRSLAGLRVDVGAEGYAARGGAVRAVVDELGLGAAVVRPAPRAEWIAGLPGGAALMPAATIRGIPENPWDEGVRRLIGWRGTWRAYLDRLRPPLTIGQERSLGRLVRTRMGEEVLERMVAPLSLGAFSIHPDDVDVDVAAPGLNNALTRTGSLAGAVSQVRADAALRPPEPGLEGLEGGMSRLVDALESRLRDLGARIRTGTPAEALVPASGGRWTIAFATDAEPETADHVILATGSDDARRLLAGRVPALQTTPTTAIEVVTIVLTSPELSARPVRTAVYPLAGRGKAASVTDSTARWPWLREDAGPGVHVLKVTFGAPGEPPATAELDESGAVALAISEASTLRGVPLRPDAVRAAHRAGYRQPPPVSALGHREAVDAARRAIDAVPGLSIVGAAVAGTGIAQVVPDALAEAERLRRTVLWGSAEER